MIIIRVAMVLPVMAQVVHSCLWCQ